MLCTFCADFNLDDLVSLAGYQHHRSYSDLLAAAKAGCGLCEAVHAEHVCSGSYANGNDVQASGPITCSLGLVSSRLQWEWQSEGHSMVIAMAVSSVPGGPSEMVINATPICIDVASDSCFKIMSNWLEQCLASHPLCSQTGQYSRLPDTQRYLPSGVIDLGGRFRPLPGAGAHAFWMHNHPGSHGQETEGSENMLLPDNDISISDKESLLPSRVIDVGSAETDPFLLISEKGKRGTWMALSHCWGHASAFTTKTKTLKKRVERIQMDELPPTFRDAVLITRRLGHQYLWIDSLCIVQDSPEDWLEESARMGYIYKHASLTIAAEAGVDSNAGIFESTNKSRIKFSAIQVPYHRTDHSSGGQMYVQRLLDSPDEARGPLSQRAWTLQEELLSPRTLRFAAQQVWWRCREFQCNERDRFGVSFESRWNSHDAYQVAVGEDREESGPTGQRKDPGSGVSSAVEDKWPSDSDSESSMNKAGFAESGDESDSKGEFAFWTPGRSIKPVRQQNLSYEQSDNESIHSLSHMSPPKPKSTPRRKPIKLHPGTPELSEDAPAGILDEERPIEDAYVSYVFYMQQRAHRLVPQDIDPSFPNSDSGDEVQLDEEQDTYIERRLPTLDTSSSRKLLRKWYNIVNDFAVRKITYRKDKLPAISGLAREVRRMTGGRYSYKAGIWRSREFEYQDLLWGITIPLAARYEKYIAPSWSWASMDLSGSNTSQDSRSRLYSEALLEDLRPKIEVKTMFTKTVGGDPYMQVLDGRLKIEGLCRNVCGCEIPSVFFDIHDESIVAPTGPWDIVEAIDSKSSNGIPSNYVQIFKDFRRDLIGKTFCEVQPGWRPSSDRHRPLLLLEVADWSSSRYRATASICLILQRTEHDVNDEEDIFERVGRAFVLKEPAGMRELSRWQTQILTIK